MSIIRSWAPRHDSRPNTISNERSIMRALIATLALTSALLGAGSFAADQSPSTAIKLSNTTVIPKNQLWPVKRHIVFGTCRAHRRLDA